MHTTPLENCQFEITFCETNLRYLLGDEKPDTTKIESMRERIATLKEKEKTLSPHT